MFESQKSLKAIERARQEIEKEKQLLLQEKEELLFIKNQLEDTTPKIDISNVYVFKEYGISRLVNLYREPISGENKDGQKIDGYRSTLIDIFSGSIIYEKKSVDPIQREETIYHELYTIGNPQYHCVTCHPICEAVPDLLAYPDKQVPLYILQQHYYRLNNVKVSVLKKLNNHYIKGGKI